MSKTNCAWRFDKALLKEKHFFSTCVTGENLTITILRSGNGMHRLLGGFLLIHMKGVGRWRTWAKRIRSAEASRKELMR